MHNTVRLKISSPELIERYGLSWVLRRQRINAVRWPVLGEELTVITAPSGFVRGLQTFRDFHLQDASGQVIISAATQWLLMDISTRRLKPIPKEIAALETDLAPAAAHLDRPAGKVRPPDQPHLNKSFEVAFGQLDFNDHLTNPIFPELMLEPLGHEFLSTQLPVSSDIMFYQEARYGDQLEAVVGNFGLPPHPPYHRFDHALLRDETLLSTMSTKWSEIV